MTGISGSMSDRCCWSRSAPQCPCGALEYQHMAPADRGNSTNKPGSSESTRLPICTIARICVTLGCCVVVIPYCCVDLAPTSQRMYLCYRQVRRQEQEAALAKIAM